VDAFVVDSPSVYDFEVNPQWHQVTLYNPDKERPKLVGIDLSGPRIAGSLGLKPDREYYLFDFWNHRLIGKRSGGSRLEQSLRPGEARMISVRECLDHPQVVSTDRHVMQGYLDLLRAEWDDERHELTGVSKIVGRDPYVVSLALNRHVPRTAQCKGKGITARLSPPQEGIVELCLEGPENGTVEWSVSFRADGS
jgi:hypothetical protein